MYESSKPYKARQLLQIKSTWNTPYLSVINSTYAIFNPRHYEVDHTDGIGTKGFYHWKARSFENAVLDVLAMNLNDLAMVRAYPYKLQNHIVIPNDDMDAISTIIKILVRESKRRKIAITGGETSIQNTLKGMDISVTMSGFIKKPMRNKMRVGDILIGLPSSGLHSNGFTKVREVFKNRYRTDFIIPTTIYHDTVLKTISACTVHGMMHITGGAFTKLKDISKEVNIHIWKNHKLKVHKVFYDLYERGISDTQMYKTFNCGIGFIISVSKKDSNLALQLTKGEVIGEVTAGSGKMCIESVFSNRNIYY